MLSRVSCNKCLAGEQYRACSSLSRKHLVTRKPAVRARGGDFSAIRMRKKYYSLADCLDGLCSAGYNHSGDGRGNCFLLLRSRPARRHSYGPASRTCSVQVGRDGEIKLHYHECCLSSFPRQSKQVLWLSQQPQRFVSSRAVLTCSICSGVGYWLYLHRR